MLVLLQSQRLRLALTVTLPVASKIVILGGGFAGVAAGQALARNPKVQTTLISRQSSQVYYPALYEAACEEITRQTVLIPLRQIFSETSVQVVLDQVIKVDKNKRQVYLKSGDRHDYDYLVLALGAESNDFGIKGVKEHAYIFRELKETILLRDHIRTVFHLAEERGQEQVEIVVCGGGFSGVELAAELRHHISAMVEDYPTEKVGITILEAGKQILPGMEKKVVKLTEAKLTELGITVKLGDPVGEVTKDGVRLKSGAWIPSDVTVWTAGTKPSPIPAEIGLPVDDKGRPVVSPTLNVLGYRDIFVAGDLAGFTDPKTGKGIAPQAHYAIEMGRVVGENIDRSVRGLTLKEFKPDPLDIIVLVGHNYAVASFNGRVSSGWWPLALRKIIEFRYLIGLFGIVGAWPVFWEEIKVMAD